MNEYINAILSANLKPKSILEIGSRDGHDSNTLKKYFNISDENVWLVEPNPSQIKKIKEIYPHFNLVESAISNTNSSFSFNCVKDEEYIGVSSILDRVDGFYNNITTEKITVNTITGKQLLKQINLDYIDLCKIDVEGLTYEVIESFENKIKSIRSMHIECEHKEIWKNQKLFLDVEHLLKSFNFEMVYFEYICNETIQSDSIWLNRA